MEDSHIRATNTGSVETNILLTGSLIQFRCILTWHTSFSSPANAIFFRPQPTAVLPTDTPPDMQQHIKRFVQKPSLGDNCLPTNKTPRWTYNGRVFDDTVYGRNPKSLHNMQIALKKISTLVQNTKPTYKWMIFYKYLKHTVKCESILTLWQYDTGDATTPLWIHKGWWVRSCIKEHIEELVISIQLKITSQIFEAQKKTG